MLRTTTPPLLTYKRTANRTGWALVLFVPLFYILTGSVEGVFSLLPMHNGFVRVLYGVLATVAYIAPFILSGVFFYLLSIPDKGMRATSRRVSFRPRMLALMPLLVLAGLAINLVAASANAQFCEWIGYTVPEDTVLEGYDDAGAVILYMTTAIAPAFAEEFLFRGVVYANLRPFGKWQAVLISAMIFALMHENIGQLFYTFVCGIVLALMYEYTGSIWCGLIFHLFNNQLSCLAETLIYGRYGESAGPYLELWNIAVIVMGSVSIIILLIYGLAVRSRQKKNREAPAVFGRMTDETEVWDAPVSRSAALGALITPGMLTFIILEVFSIVVSYILVLFLNIAEAWL